MLWFGMVQWYSMVCYGLLSKASPTWKRRLGILLQYYRFIYLFQSHWTVPSLSILDATSRNMFTEATWVVGQDTLCQCNLSFGESLPGHILAGVFFSVKLFDDWLPKVCLILPSVNHLRILMARTLRWPHVWTNWEWSFLKQGTARGGTNWPVNDSIVNCIDYISLTHNLLYI